MILAAVESIINRTVTVQSRGDIKLSNSKNTLFTIGQFATLHGVNKKTLMWYDEVGLFHPAVIKENGYRYYNYFQSPTLETILTLRELNVSISEIQTFLQDRSASRLETLFGDKILELDRTLEHLQNIRKILVHQRRELSALQTLDLSEISVMEKEEQRLVILKTPQGSSLEKEIELVIAETKKYELQRLHDATYGSVISVENLRQGKYEEYAGMFMRLPESTAQTDAYIRPKGKYLQAYCKGNWNKLSHKYAEILKYAEANGISLYGYAYETGINEIVVQSIEEYITLIEIPIRE